MLEIRSCEGGTLERHAILGSAVGAGSMFGQAFRVPVFVGMSVVLLLCVWALARWVRPMRMLLN